MDIVNITLKLEKDLLDFSNLFLSFHLKVGSSVDTLKESVLLDKLSNESKNLLLDMKECQTRIDNDIFNLKIILEKKLQYDKGAWFKTNRNVVDALQTCEKILTDYNNFLRKDISLLKETFEKLEKSIKNLNNLISDYNKIAQFKLETVSEKYETLNKIIFLGFKITDCKLLTFEDFQKLYPDADITFLRYLKGTKDNLKKRKEWEWLNTLEKYFDTFNKNIRDVIYPKL